MILTPEMLRFACSPQMEQFLAEWPEGGEITWERVLRAFELGLDIHWCAYWAMPERFMQLYKRRALPLRRAYIAALAPYNAAIMRIDVAYVAGAVTDDDQIQAV